MPAILFVCTANRFRSPLAAAIFRNMLAAAAEPGEWQVASAGTWTAPGQAVVPDLQALAQNLQLDLAGHRSLEVSAGLLNAQDLILTMEPGQQEALGVEFPALRERIHLLSAVVENKVYAVPDTFQTEAEVLQVARLLQTLLSAGYRSICDLATKLQESQP